MSELQVRVVEGQRAKMLEVAARMAETTRRDLRIFLFGTGHSHLIAEEGFYRAGGLANVVPLAFSTAGNIPGISPSRGIAGVATIAYAAFLAGPPLVGQVKQFARLRGHQRRPPDPCQLSLDR